MHTLRPLMFCWILGCLTGCVTDLNFDDIAPVCEGNVFDVPSYDQYCSGELERSGETPLEEDQVVLELDQDRGEVVSVSAIREVSLEDQTEIPFFNNLTFTFTPRGDLLTSESPDLGPIEVVPPTDTLGFLPTTPRRTRMLDGDNLIAGSIAEGLFGREDDDGVDYAQLLLMVDAEHELFGGVLINSRVFGQFNPSLDLAAVSDGEDLQVFLALGALGIKPIHYRLSNRDRLPWDEVPAFDIDDQEEVREIAEIMAPYTPGIPSRPRTFCEQRQGAFLADCLRQCRDECGVGNILEDECFSCRLEQNVFYPLSGETIRAGAYSLETIVDFDTDDYALLVGNNGSLDVYDISELELPLSADRLEPFPVDILDLETSDQDFSQEDYIVTEILHQDGLIAFVFQDRRVIPEPFVQTPGPALPAYLGMVDWDNGFVDGSLRVIELPSEFIATNRVRLALMDNNLLAVRTLQTDLVPLGEETDFALFRGVSPFTALFENTGTGLKPLYSWQTQEDGSQDQYGMIHNPDNGRLLVSEEGMLRGYRLTIEGNPQ